MASVSVCERTPQATFIDLQAVGAALEVSERTMLEALRIATTEEERHVILEVTESLTREALERATLRAVRESIGRAVEEAMQTAVSEAAASALQNVDCMLTTQTLNEAFEQVAVS